MLHTKAHNASHLKQKAIAALKQHGIQSVNDGSYRSGIVDLKLSNNRARHHAHPSNNIFSSIAATFWVMAGADNIYNPYWEAFLKYNNSNVGIFSVREVLTKFTPQAIAEEPLNISNMVFSIDHGKFNMVVTDDYLNVDTFDIFPYAFLHELLGNEVRKVYPDIQHGTVTARGLIGLMPATLGENIERENIHTMFNTTPLTGPLAGIPAWPHFFNSLIAQFGSMLTQTPAILKSQMGDHWAEIESLFDTYGVGYGDLMYEYVALVYAYIVSAKGLSYQHRTTKRLNGDLLEAVTFSHHRRFELME